MTAAPATGTSVNRRAAKAVVLNARDTDEARLLLDMLGLVDGPEGREVLPDDVRLIEVATIKGVEHQAEARRPGAGEDRERPSGATTTPPGLRDLPVEDRPAGRRTRPKPVPTPCAAPLAPPPDLAPAATAEPPPPARDAPAPATSSRRRTGPSPKPIPHGSLAGYRAHYRRRELPVCDACKDAYNNWRQAKDAAEQAETAAEQAAANSRAIAVELDTWFAGAQQSPNRAVQRAAAVAVGALLQLRFAMDDLARAERRATQ